MKHSESSYNKRTNFVIRIVILSIITLLVSSCALQKANSAGTVNGKNIDAQEFMNSVRGHYTGFILEKDRTPDESEKRAIGRQTWRDITIHIILQDYFRKYQIQVTQQEVTDTLLNNIPASMLSASAFQNNGVFDKPAYVKSLLEDKPQKLDWLRNYYYQYYVPLQKLKTELQRKSVITKNELSDLFKTVNSKADIEWVVFDPAADNVTVTQSEIENYYESRQSDYAIKAYASFGWVVLPVSSSEQDVYTAKAKIDSLANEIRNGGSFGSLAQQFSEAPTADDKGSMGFVNSQSLPKAAQQAISKLEVNQTTFPVQLDDEWVIYELVERTKTLEKLNEIAIKISPGGSTRQSFKLHAIDLRDLALQLGLKSAASEMSYDYSEIYKVPKDSTWMADPNLGAYFVDRAFTQKAGAVLEPVYSKVMQAWVLAQVLDVQPYLHKPLLSVSDEISGIIKSQKQVANTIEQAKFWSEEHRTNPLSAATAANLRIIKTPGLMISDKINNQPIWKIYVDVLSNYKSNKPGRAYKINDLILLPIVTKVTEIVPPAYDEQQVRQYYFSYINPEWFDKWLEGEISKASVTIKVTYP